MHNRELEQLYTKNIKYGSQPIPLYRHIVREFASKTDVVKAVTSVDDTLKGGSHKKNSIRFQPTKKITDREEHLKKFRLTLQEVGLEVVEEIPPGPDAPSSKYETYKVLDTDGNTYLITLGGGAMSNKGMEYERIIVDQLKTFFDSDRMDEEPKFLKDLEKEIHETFVRIEAGFHKSVKRPLTSDGPSDKGEAIADFTLYNEDDKPFYISLKNVNGFSIANAGASGMFGIKNNQVVYLGQEKNQIGGKLMRAAGVNFNDVLHGLTDYLQKRQSPEELLETHETTQDADKDILFNFLKSAFDFGYFYVKEQKSGKGIEVVDLTTEEKLEDYLGEIKKVKVKYPYYKSDKASRKMLSIDLITKSFVYSFAIRDSQGGFLPKVINLVKLGSNKEAKEIEMNAKKIEKSKQELEDLLSAI